MTSIMIAALYKFVDIQQPEEFAVKLEALCDQYKVTGMLIVAEEGLNGTISSSSTLLPQMLEELFTYDPRLRDLEIKFSYSDSQPFYRMRVSRKKEIVTLGVKGYRPLHINNPKVHELSPLEWNELIKNEDVTLVDTRNDYEVELGTFRGALDPHTKSFRQFPAYIESLVENTSCAKSSVEEVKPNKLAIFCTGGIRCDKVSSLVADLPGVNEVYTLKGGILKYLETVPAENSLWEGECFVFDQRVTVTHGLQVGESSLCRACRHPLTISDRSREDFKEGINCRYCIGVLSEEQRKGAEQRQLQIELCKQRNEKHLGYVHPGHAKKQRNAYINANNISNTEVK